MIDCIYSKTDIPQGMLRSQIGYSMLFGLRSAVCYIRIDNDNETMWSNVAERNRNFMFMAIDPIVKTPGGKSKGGNKALNVSW